MTSADPHLPLPTDASAEIASRAAAWAEPGFAGNWRRQFFYWLMRLGGKARGYHMANIVSLWYVLFHPSIRRRCGFYLNRRFPDRQGMFRRMIDCYRFIRSYATTLVDMQVLSMFGPSSVSAVCPDHARLVELASNEHGFVLIQAHVGCWQVALPTLGQFRKKVSIVMIPQPLTLSTFDPAMASPIDPRTGLQGAMEMTEALLRGDILAMMGDRTFGNEQHLVGVQFLGGNVLLPTTPYRLASATGVPVVVVCAPRTGRGSYKLRLARVINVPAGLGRAAENYAPYARQFADCMEQFVMEYPWQFYNFYNFWDKGNGT
jgi:predicted LPLAT superfamily acyltransferase